jgi:uncharacterized membrane protein YfcA
MPEDAESNPRSKPLAFGVGAFIGALGGLIGLGGAEFRLPVLISLFRFRGLEAVILNKATSLVVVATALPFRATTVPFAAVGASWPIIINLLAGSLAGAWFGAGWATRLKTETLYRVIAVLLVLIAAILLFAHDTVAGSPPMTGAAQMVAGIVAGFVIGVIASLLGLAGGEFLIPTLVLLFGADIKLAGSLSLAVSLPTMLVGFTRYSMDDSFFVLGRNKLAGSMVGTFVGGRLLGLVPNHVLLPILAALLLRDQGLAARIANLKRGDGCDGSNIDDVIACGDLAREDWRSALRLARGKSAMCGCARHGMKRR